MDKRRVPGSCSHHRLRPRHRQTRRAFRHPPLSLQIHGELLSGERSRRSRRPEILLHTAVPIHGRVQAEHHGVSGQGWPAESVQHVGLLSRPVLVQEEFDRQTLRGELDKERLQGDVRPL